jgi:NAD+ kinase
MVISPDSQIAIDVESLEALVSADGFRKVELQKDDRVIIRKTAKKMSILHIESAVFTDRLVAKFRLPIEGWRGE